MKKRPREPKPLHPMLVSATGSALIKHLASCNTTVRSQSLRLIQSWLASQTQHLSDSDIKKLWKGLFYCLWHADKTPNQLSLINRLINLFLSLQPSISLEFFRGFLVTLRREWPGIDRLRLDKFYLLIRRFMRALFELMRLRKWDLEVLGEYFGVLERDGFLSEDKLQQGEGVNYHIVSVFLDELKGVGFPVRKEVVDMILRPFFEVMMRGKDKILLGKLKSCVFDELVKVGKDILAKKRMGADWHEKDGDVLLGVVALRMGLSGRFYEVGSSVECVQGNRKLALGLHEEFLKLEKELELAGVEIPIPEYSDAGGDDGEVPQLIPIEYNASNCNVEFGSQEGADDAHEDGDWSDERSFKKSKKVGKGIDGEDKKAKQKKKKKKKKKIKRKVDNGVSEINLVIKENGDSVTTNGMEIEQSFTANSSILNDGLGSDGSPVHLNEIMISNLQKQFEKVAAERGSYSDENSDSSDTPLISVQHGILRKKRKKTESADLLESGNLGSNGADAASNSAQKSVKKVRFCMKNNLVWKPQTPLPPESLRLPPSVTPRGSALKKGVPPGPIIETPPVKKKVKQKKAPKKLKGAARSKLLNKKVHA
ncbi:Nucleolar protein NOP52/RRP1 [Handroanthus impetiginosus]|uniref:Nucleolar protein NOP52/RRP1 n=1 Tax=Handroanthus impetiginosus TaxID=429701 RepID=A0A2G9GBK1_9LAMI|nr:Nucleolar protein NOP52/RRP1 [Handroanthus impetiginosus]